MGTYDLDSGARKQSRNLRSQRHVKLADFWQIRCSGATAGAGDPNLRTLGELRSTKLHGVPYNSFFRGLQFWFRCKLSDRRKLPASGNLRMGTRRFGINNGFWQMSSDFNVRQRTAECNSPAFGKLEVAAGFEPANNGFATRCESGGQRSPEKSNMALEASERPPWPILLIWHFDPPGPSKGLKRPFRSYTGSTSIPAKNRVVARLRFFTEGESDEPSSRSSDRRSRGTRTIYSIGRGRHFDKNDSKPPTRIVVWNPQTIPRRPRQLSAKTAPPHPPWWIELSFIGPPDFLELMQPPKILD